MSTHASTYERLLGVWSALGGTLADRTGPEWTWRPNPTVDELAQLLAHVPVAFGRDEQ